MDGNRRMNVEMTEEDKRRLTAAAKKLSEGNMAAEAAMVELCKCLTDMAAGDQKCEAAIVASEIESAYRRMQALHSDLNRTALRGLGWPLPVPMSR